MSTPALVLVAHGSRDPAGAECVHELATAVRGQLPGTDVRTAFVDVRGPTVAEAVAGAGDAVVVPAFLAAGFHVRADLPAQLAAASGGTRCRLTANLGHDHRLVEVAAERLRDAGWHPADAVVLAAAGSSDQRALVEVRAAASALGMLVGRRVRVGYVATGAPRVDALVEGLRAAGERRVAVAAWLLAPGVFHRRLDDCGADAVAAPLGAHSAVAAAVVARYTAAASRIAA